MGEAVLAGPLGGALCSPPLSAVAWTPPRPALCSQNAAEVTAGQPGPSPPSQIFIPWASPLRPLMLSFLASHGRHAPTRGSSWLLSPSLVSGPSGCAELGPSLVQPLKDDLPIRVEQSSGPGKACHSLLLRSLESVGTLELRQPLLPGRWRPRGGRAGEEGGRWSHLCRASPPCLMRSVWASGL